MFDVILANNCDIAKLIRSVHCMCIMNLLHAVWFVWIEYFVTNKKIKIKKKSFLICEE